MVVLVMMSTLSLTVLLTLTLHLVVVLKALDVTAAEGNVTFKASQPSGPSYIIDNNDANDIFSNQWVQVAAASC